MTFVLEAVRLFYLVVVVPIVVLGSYIGLATAVFYACLYWLEHS
jgi:hypothetical protein